MRRLAFCGAVLALVFSAPSASARTMRVSAKNGRKIAAAARAAKPGDRIELRGRVKGDVVVQIAGVTLDLSRAWFDGSLTVVGSAVEVLGGDLRGGVILDGPGMTLRSAHVTGVAGIKDGGRDCFASVIAQGDGTLLDGVTIDAPAGNPAVRANGTGATVNACVVRGSGVLVEGDVASISGNVVSGGWVECWGDRAELKDNKISGPGESAVVAYGDSPTVTGNVVSASGALSVVVEGRGAVVENNSFADAGSIDASQEVVDVVGDAASVRANDVTRSRDSDADAIVVAGKGGVVADNTVANGAATGCGVYVNGDSNTVRGNSVSGGGTGVVVAGAAATVDGNKVRDVSGDGIVVSGPTATVSDSDVADVGGSGVLAFDSAVVSGGCVRNCATGGVVVFATNSSIGDCELGGNSLADVVAPVGTTTTGLGPDVVIQNDPMQTPQLAQRWKDRPRVTAAFVFDPYRFSD